MNQFVDESELEPKLSAPEAEAAPEPSHETPVFQEFGGSFKFEYRPGCFLKVRGFRLDIDLPEISEAVNRKNPEKDLAVAGQMAEDIKKSDDPQTLDRELNVAAQARSSSATRVHGFLPLENFLVAMGGGAGILGGRMRMPKMWVIEGESLKTLLWQEQAQQKGQVRDTVDSVTDPASARVNYAFVLSPADAKLAETKFPSGVMKESVYGKPSFQVEMAGVRFLFLTENMDKMNAMAMMSKDSAPADNDNAEIEDEKKGAEEPDSSESHE